MWEEGSLGLETAELPDGNDAEEHEVGEEKGSHGWGAVDEVVEGMDGGPRRLPEACRITTTDSRTRTMASRSRNLRETRMRSGTRRNPT